MIVEGEALLVKANNNDFFSKLEDEEDPTKKKRYAEIKQLFNPHKAHYNAKDL